MKKIVLLIAFITTGSICFARESSGGTQIYKVPASKTPKPVTRLGTNPEFPQLRHLNSRDEVYSAITKMDKNKGAGRSMNELFIGMGYTGIDDPDFTVNDIEKSSLPFGAQGMMGDGSHHYVYSILTVPGKQKLDAWKIRAKDGDHNDLYFLSDCGNAFYNTNAPEAKTVVVTEPAPAAKTADMKIKVYARYHPEPCGCCTTEDNKITDQTGYEMTSYEQEEDQKILLSEQKVEPTTVTENNVVVVQEVYIDVDKATYKKLKKHDPDVKYKSKTEMDGSRIYSKK